MATVILIRQFLQHDFYTGLFFQYALRNPQELINVYSYVNNNPVINFDPYGLDTWPYSWKGWGIIGVPTGALIAAFGSVPLGVAVVAVGGGLFVWDLIEGLGKGERRGIEFSKEQIMLKIKTTPIPPKRMQEIGWLPTNEELREIGFTEKDLRDLGLLEKPCTE